MVRLCHHHRCTPADVRAWPIAFYIAAAKALEDDG